MRGLYQKYDKRSEKVSRITGRTMSIIIMDDPMLERGLEDEKNIEEIRRNWFQMMRIPRKRFVKPKYTSPFIIGLKPLLPPTK